MKVCIFGSRTLRGKRVREIINSELAGKKIEYVVTSGETNGVCAMARLYCKEFSIRMGLSRSCYTLEPDKTERYVSPVLFQLGFTKDDLEG